ncbi:hypothetical protein HELRODRAFT_174267 [Helobdella robusta]|uniref:Cytochrome c oxidase subunit 3 n=1 Tax=Helobdella robusta TaxID=6412 RepID=T1F7W8_HELRO|nr:hypothetical protein HELRODRAFT_174267 [Helobdella robusta]ESO02838.1 hypothetical protein HELRODRAFT_174267 [Helobdella robusta]
MALSIRQKRVRRISGDPVDGVVVQGPVDGLATGTPLYSVAVQGTIDGRTTCRPRGWRFGTWNVGTLTGRSLEVVEELQRRMVDVAALQEVRWKGEGTRFVGAKGGRYKLWWKGDDGLYFTLLQSNEHYSSRFTIADSIYGTTFFVTTGFHGAHVIIGSTFLAICLIRVIKN